MRLFCVSQKPDVNEVFEITSRGYGVKNPARINGYAGTFLFVLPDVYVSDRLEKAMNEDARYTSTLILLIQRFKKGDYGTILEAEEEHNFGQRYLANSNTWMIACYDTDVGKIRFETFWNMALFYLDGEQIDTIRREQLEKPNAQTLAAIEEARQISKNGVEDAIGDLDS